jgi:hypothetical protein
MPHRSEDARVKDLLRRTDISSMSRIEKARALLDVYRRRNVRPGDGEFMSDDAKALFTVLELLIADVEEVKRHSHYHGDFVDG